MGTRIKDITATATSAAVDDYLELDGVTNGSRKILASAVATLSDAQALTNKTYNGNTWTAGTGVLTIAAAKTLTVSNTLTLAGTDGSALNIGAGGTLGSAAYTATSAYEVPLTFSTGLTRSTNAISVNASQVITTLSNLTSNGIVTTSGGAGTLSVTATTGSGNVVLATSPALTTPNIGVATATSINGNTWTAGTGVLTIAAAKTLTVSNTITLVGTDGTVMTFPTTSATLARTDAANTFTGGGTFNGNVSLSGAGTGVRYAALMAETGSYAGSYILQAGGGSAAYGGGLVMYGHSHATKPGWVTAGISTGSGGKFSVNAQGTGAGTEVFTVDGSGNTVANGTLTVSSTLHAGSFFTDAVGDAQIGGSLRATAGYSGDYITMSGRSSIDTYYFSQNYENANGTESVFGSGRGSWRMSMRNASTTEVGWDWRAAAAGASTFTRLMTLSSTGNLTVNAPNDNGLGVQTTNTDNPRIYLTRNSTERVRINALSNVGHVTGNGGLNLGGTLDTDHLLIGTGGAVGLGGAAASSQLHLTNSITQTGSDIKGLRLSSYLRPSNGTTGELLVVDGTVDTSSGNQTTASAATFQLSTAGANTVTNGYGLHIQSPSGTNVTNQYSLKIENVSVGTTLNYAIYTGAGLVNFGDKVTIDGTSRSLAAYTTAGAMLSILARSITDTSSSGTVAVNAVNAIARPTLLASSSTTYTDSATVYIAGAPIASTNVTQTRTWALYALGSNFLNDLYCGDGSADQSLKVKATNTTGNGARIDFWRGGASKGGIGTLGGWANVDNNNLAIFAQAGISVGIYLNSSTAAALVDSTGLALTGSITTGAPSGGTAAAWKLGTVASVSPTSPNRTIELDVAGTRYFLAAKTTND
jgi:hypothetical protein